jgi:hypothetical protein
MKKILILLFVLTVLAGWAQAGESFHIRFTGNLLMPADSGYKDVYGKSVFYPELKAGYAFSADFYVWAGYGFVNKKGETPVLKLAAESTQNFISIGLGYGGAAADALGYFVELGLVNAYYKEEAMGVKESGSVLGFRADAGLTYVVASPLFISLEAGYIATSKKVNEVTIKPGGLKAGLGIGARF